MGKFNIMIFDATYSDRMVDLEITKLTGRSFGWFSKERWSGIGSERYQIISSSGEVENIFEGDYVRNFTNIELRPKGIVIRIRYRLNVYAVAIPYQELTIKFPEESVHLSFPKGEMNLQNSRRKLPRIDFFKKILTHQVA